MGEEVKSLKNVIYVSYNVGTRYVVGFFNLIQKEKKMSTKPFKNSTKKGEFFKL
jgi:hypothetical protein